MSEKKSRSIKLQNETMYKEVKSYLTDDGLIDYVDTIRINPTYTIEEIRDYPSSVSICAGSNEGYFIDINLLDRLVPKEWCCIRTHEDIDTAINIHNSMSRHYIK